MLFNGSLTASKDVSIWQHLTVSDVKATGSAVVNTGTLLVVVGGSLGARHLYVVAPAQPWPDYVFRKGCRLRPLPEVARFVQAHHYVVRGGGQAQRLVIERKKTS